MDIGGMKGQKEQRSVSKAKAQDSCPAVGDVAVEGRRPPNQDKTVSE